MDHTKLVSMFKTEAAEHVDTINRTLLALERQPEQATYDEVFRSAHSLKGAARTVGYKQIETISHRMESVFGKARRGELALTPARCDVLYQAVDTIQYILEHSAGLQEAAYDVSEVLDRLNLILDGQEPARAQPHLPIPPTELQPIEEPDLPTIIDSEETIRVELSKIEALMAQAGELLISKIRADQRAADLKRMRTEFTHVFRSNNYSALNGLLAELATLEKDVKADALRLSLLTGNLQDDIRRVRMLPFATIIGGFERMVRDLARQNDKDVRLVVSGADSEIDKHVLDALRDPLMHMLRNSIAHGIEPPEERLEQGKAAHGTITLDVSHQGSYMTITLTDDGSGIDLDTVKQQAQQSGLVTEDTLATMSDHDALQLTMLAGISTTTHADDLSGRGVGLDVVRQTMQELHGHIEIESTPQQGSTFTLTAPISLATTRSLLVRVGPEIYAIPIAAVASVIDVNVDDIHMAAGREVITLDGRAASVLHLKDTLERPHRLSQRMAYPAFVLRAPAGNQIVYLVDELLDEQEMVVKSLGKLLPHVRNVAGAALLGSGQVVIMLNTADLITSAQGTVHSVLESFDRSQPDDSPRHTILVVDDSITTRTLEKNILEAAGYQVVTAVDGTEAMSYLETNTCDLVVSDIEMPHMNGFDLTRNIKNSRQPLPLILVTSLESDEDRRRGLDAGADAYVVKNAFNQEDLLMTIDQLVGGVR